MQDGLDKLFTRIRSITIGGNSKQQLFQELEQQSILLNDFAKTLFDSDLFVISREKYNLNVVELKVVELGFPHGAKMKEIINKAKAFRLSLCPLELGPYLRLAYHEQPEGNNSSNAKLNQAPEGSVTVISKPLLDNDDFPKGFYLRKIDGFLWLRGYIADDEHVWNPSDRLIFVMQ